jgi:hypothetical protein
MKFKDEFLRLALSQLGRRGDQASATKMTAEQRAEFARKAGKAGQAKAQIAGQKRGGAAQ